jgi:hypothetical protein
MPCAKQNTHYGIRVALSFVIRQHATSNKPQAIAHRPNSQPLSLLDIHKRAADLAELKVGCQTEQRL